ncbi:sporulation delaying protein family toxin [Streptomyces olivaceoviridis]
MNRSTFRTVAASAATALALGIAAPAMAFDNATSTKSGPTITLASQKGAKVGTAQDGRDILAGLFFIQGEVGKQFADIPEYTEAKKNYKANNSAKAKKATALVMDAMAKKDKGFFADYSAKLRSGDPRKVDAGMSKAVTLLNKVVSRDEKELGVGSGKCVISVLAVQSLVVVTTGGAAAVSVAVVAQAWKWVVNTSMPPANSSDLSKDQKIADITKLLAAA